MNRPSGFALLPDCFSSWLRNRGTMGDFIPQTPSLGTSPQTPSSLRADCSLLSEKDMKSMRDSPLGYGLTSQITHPSCRKATAQSGSRELSSLVGFGAKPQSFFPIVPRYSRIPSKPHLRITNYTSPKKQLSQSDSAVRVKGTEFPCGVWGKAPIVSPNRP